MSEGVKGRRVAAFIPSSLTLRLAPGHDIHGIHGPYSPSPFTPSRRMNMIQNNLFIDGEFVDAESKSRIPVLNPHDNSLITEVAEAQKADIDRAVEAARKAFPAWAKLAAGDRRRLLLKLADAIDARAEDLAKLETLDTGHPLRDTKGLDVV